MEMSTLAAGMQVAGPLLGAFGAGSSMSAARAEALRRQQAANYEAAQLETQAGQQIAASQRTALDRARDARLVQSRALAVAAASGGGVSDPTVVNLIGKVAGEGAYRQGLALYQGEDAARTLRMAAEAKRYEGEQAIATGEAKAQAYAMQGAGGLLKGSGSMFQGASTLFSKYSGGGFAGGSGDAALIGGFDPEAMAVLA